VILRHGVLAALVVRFVPVLPFTLLNYACGVTAMRLRHYVLGTAIGLLPGTSAVVALGSRGAQLSLWVPALASVGLGLASLAAGLIWHHRSRFRLSRLRLFRVDSPPRRAERIGDGPPEVAGS
jgi:uncharacterized membrane protein YdjX (TVP38/TMEM64 family)